jgi:CBS domain-containing protein
MKIDKLYRRDVVTVGRGETLAAAARRMRMRQVGSAAVFDRGRLVGILTEHDLARAAADGADPLTTRLELYLTPEPAAAAVDEEADRVALRMLALGVRHLPVIRGEAVVGMISMRDLLRSQARLDVAARPEPASWPTATR